jgi:putative ABC transport system substrate-binding protein
MIKPVFTLFSAALILISLQAAEAQKQATTSRIGILYLGAPNANLDAFVQGLRELGYIEGKNTIIDYRFAEGKEDRLPELAIELVGLKVDAIFTAGTPFSRLSERLKQSPLFSSALAIRLEPVLSLVSLIPVATSRA